MGEIIFFALFTIPALLGVAELIHLIKVYIISPKNTAVKYLLIFLGKNSPYEQLTTVAEEFFWRGKKYAQNIIAVNLDISDEDYIYCRSFCDKNNFIFCNVDEISEYAELLSGKV